MVTPKQRLFCPKVVTVTRATSLFEAARLMREHHIGDVVVTESQNSRQRPIGILTDRDIVIEVLAEELDPKQLKVGDIMTNDPIVGQDTAHLYEWITLMRVNGIKRLPIVDMEGSLVGIVSFENILEMVGLELSGLAKLSSRQRKIEKELRRHAHG